MKTRFVAMVLAAMMLLSGCAPSEPVATVSVTPHYNQPEVKTPSPTPAIASLDSSIAVDMIKEEFQITFTVLERSEESPKSGNSYLSTYYEYIKAPFPYYDEVNDTLYYVNYGNNYDPDRGYLEVNDSYLYAIKGDKNEPIVKMPVNYPNFYKDYIYFMSNENAFDLYEFNSFPAGKLYRYNKSDESIELVMTQDIKEFCIVGDYLYYRTADSYEVNSNGTYEVDSEGYIIGFEAGKPFRMLLDGGEPEETDGFLPQFYGEYQLRYTPLEKTDEYGGYVGALELVSEHETIRIGDAFPSSNGGYGYIIYEDTLWFFCRIDEITWLTSIDLPTGNVNAYTIFGERNIDRSYAILNGELYMAAQSDIYKLDKESGKFIKILGFFSLRGSTFYMRTDGRYIYAVVSYGWAESQSAPMQYYTHLVRLDFLEDGQCEPIIVSVGDRPPDRE